MNLIAKWFKKGQDSIKRKNKSGCVCIINDKNEIESLCGLHEELIEKTIDETIKRVIKMGIACEFYPFDGSPICKCNSNIAGIFICTKEYSKTCPWAIEKRKGV